MTRTIVSGPIAVTPPDGEGSPELDRAVESVCAALTSDDDAGRVALPARPLDAVVLVAVQFDDEGGLHITAGIRQHARVLEGSERHAVVERLLGERLTVLGADLLGILPAHLSAFAFGLEPEPDLPPGEKPS